MDKNQIIEIIKSNPKIDKDKLKAQASSAGVDEAAFLEAWKEVNGSKEENVDTPKAEKTKEKARMGNSPSVGWVIKQSNALIRKHIVLFLVLIAIFILPFNIWLYVSMGNIVSVFDTGEAFGAGSLNMLIIPSILIAVFSFFLSILVISVVKIENDKSEVNFNSVFSFGLHRILPAIWTSIILTVLLIVLFVLLIVPGIIFSLYWAFALTIVIFHNVSGMKALRESKELVKGRWFLTFGNLILLGLVIIAVSILFVVAGFGFEFIGAFLPVSFAPYTKAIFDSFTVLITVYSGLVMSNFYLEMLRTKQS